MKLGLVCVALITGCIAVNPERPRSPSGGRSPLADCSGVVGFSATGLDRVHTSKLVSYKSVHANTDGGFQKETGEYTASCPGFYFITFGSFPKTSATVRLMKLPKSSREWQELLRTGSGGGSHQILIPLAQGDQLAVFADGPLPDATLNTAFSGFLLTKK